MKCPRALLFLQKNNCPHVGFSEIPLESRDITVRISRKIVVFRQMGKQTTVLDFLQSHPYILLMVTISIDIFTRDLSCRAKDVNREYAIYIPSQK